jgi:predicted metal-dependent phosphoesterase TrpH
MNSPVDLHVHSTASDGRLSPAGVVALAAERKIKLLALTDHDTTAGLPAARADGESLGVNIIAGVEVNTDSVMGEVHLLGYFAQADQPALQAALADLQHRRLERAEAILEKLEQAGAPLTLEQVRGGEASTVITRAHIAAALVTAGHAADNPAAFELYLGRGRPAFVPRYAFSPQQAIELIRASGGIVSLAHPVRSGNTAHVAELVRLGLQAVEVYYADHSSADVAGLKNLAEQHGLLRTGGSDFHQERRDGQRGLGSVFVPEADGQALLARLHP